MSTTIDLDDEVFSTESLPALVIKPLTEAEQAEHNRAKRNCLRLQRVIAIRDAITGKRDPWDLHALLVCTDLDPAGPDTTIDGKGNTAMHYAMAPSMMTRDQDAVAAILSMEVLPVVFQLCSPHVRNAAGQTPMEIAEADCLEIYNSQVKGVL